VVYWLRFYVPLNTGPAQANCCVLFFGSSAIAGHGLPPVTAGIGMWLDGVGHVTILKISLCKV